MYKVRFYKKNGNLEKEVLVNKLDKAEEIRLEYILKNNITKYSCFPTIWKYNGTGNMEGLENFTRILGY